jgi:prepilin-type N-terminal cleavage/methylation domain-containing protein
MKDRTNLSRLRQNLLASPHRKTEGFTLIELLVVTVIAGGIVAGLMFIVVQLLGVDQRESARSETQREMQMALDFMSSELREAVYVYDADSLQGFGAEGRTTAVNVPNGDNLNTILPTNLFDASVPVLAFWKHQPFPTAALNKCADAAQRETPAFQSVPCNAGSSYALVVYALSTKDATPKTWSGQARITRYTFTQFQQNGDLRAGYVSPATTGFRSWPYGPNATTSATENLLGGRIGNTPLTPLVDFVSTNATDFVSTTNPMNDKPSCPAEYGAPAATMTPPDAWLTAGSLEKVRSFYACVRTGGEDTNAEVALYLQGNAVGRPGVFTKDNFLPTLQTRVLGRGVLSRSGAN